MTDGQWNELIAHAKVISIFVAFAAMITLMFVAPFFVIGAFVLAVLFYMYRMLLFEARRGTL